MKNVLICLVALFVVAFVIYDCLPVKQREKSGVSGFAMGSVLNISVYGGSEDTSENILNAVNDLENKISANVGNSYVSLINRNSSAKTDGEFVSYINKLTEIAERTGGMLDITAGRLVELWGIDKGNTEVPAKEAIAQALEYTDYKKISVSGNTVFVPKGFLLDFGAVGKGMACDTAKQIIQQDSSVSGAVVSSGGSIMLYGKNNNNNSKKWTVGIRHPKGGANDIIAALSLGECFVSTSGDYEKYFTAGDRRYCHILSPETGYPADSDCCSVTVVADSGLLSDALSTACFLLGYEKSLPLLNHYGAEAVFITNDLEIKTTDGLKNALKEV